MASGHLKVPIYACRVLEKRFGVTLGYTEYSPHQHLMHSYLSMVSLAERELLTDSFSFHDGSCRLSACDPGGVQCGHLKLKYPCVSGQHFCSLWSWDGSRHPECGPWPPPSPALWAEVGLPWAGASPGVCEPAQYVLASSGAASSLPCTGGFQECPALLGGVTASSLCIWASSVPAEMGLWPSASFPGGGEHWIMGNVLIFCHYLHLWT